MTHINQNTNRCASKTHTEQKPHREFEPRHRPLACPSVVPQSAVALNTKVNNKNYSKQQPTLH